MSHSFLQVAKITGVHGVHGALKVMPYTQTPQELATYTPWYFSMQAPTTDKLPSFTPVKVVPYGAKGLLAQFAEITTPEAARLWVNSGIYIARSQLPPLERGYYWADLEGLKVLRLDGTCVGTVAYLFETGANDVLVVRDERRQEHFIPYRLDTVITQVNLDEGFLVVDWDFS